MVASFPGSPKCEHCLAPQLFKLFWPPGYAYVQLNPLYPHVVHVLRKDTRLSPPSWLPCLRSGTVKPGNETWEWVKEMLCAKWNGVFLLHPRQHATTTRARKSTRWWRWLGWSKDSLCWCTGWSDTFHLGSDDTSTMLFSILFRLGSRCVWERREERWRWRKRERKEW